MLLPEKWGTLPNMPVRSFRASVCVLGLAVAWMLARQSSAGERWWVSAFVSLFPPSFLHLKCLNLNLWLLLILVFPGLLPIPPKVRKWAASGCLAAGLGLLTTEWHQEKAQKTFYWYISVWEIPHFAFNWPYKLKKQVFFLILKTLNSYSCTEIDYCSHCILSKLNLKLAQLNGSINWY